MKSEKVEMYLALVRGLLSCVPGDWSCLADSTVDRLDEGVWVVIFGADSGVSHMSQLSVSSSTAAGLLEWRAGRSVSFSARGVAASLLSEGL